MKNQEITLQKLLNQLENLEKDWKDNQHLFLVKRRSGDHFPTMKKLRLSVFWLGGMSLLWCLLIAYKTHSLFVFYPNFIIPTLVFGYPFYQYYLKALQYEAACKQYEEKRNSLIEEIRILKSNINEL